MLYDYDLRKILRRYSPVWFRWPENQSMAYALSRRLKTLDGYFFKQRAVVALEWMYNGLWHSLEWALNDKYDMVQRRIWLALPDHEAYIFYASAEDAPLNRFGAAGEPLSHQFFSAQQLAAAVEYSYEFDINVPDTLGLNASAVFGLVDLYRFAGRRPRVIIRGPLNAIYGIHYYADYYG